MIDYTYLELGCLWTHLAPAIFNRRQHVHPMLVVVTVNQLLLKQCSPSLSNAIWWLDWLSRGLNDIVYILHMTISNIFSWIEYLYFDQIFKAINSQWSKWRVISIGTCYGFSPFGAKPLTESLVTQFTDAAPGPNRSNTTPLLLPVMTHGRNNKKNKISEYGIGDEKLWH